jgi:regulator of cell morphogenesis and NO signaling
MTTITPSTTLGQIVTSHPELARALEHHRLDYCCGGSRTLSEACASQGLDTAAVLGELADARTGDQSAEWSRMTAGELVDHLERTHHQFLWHELPRLSVLLDKVASVHGGRHPELAAIVESFTAIRADLEPHLLKEERVLFPMVRELFTATTPPTFHCGTLRSPISVMLSEHDHVGDLLATLRQQTNDYTTPGDGCASYAAAFGALAELEADTHLHIHKENNVLFPMVVDRENTVRMAS